MPKKSFGITTKSFSKKRAKNIWLALKELTNLDKGYIYIWQIYKTNESYKRLIDTKRYENKLEIRRLNICTKSYNDLMINSGYFEDKLIELIWDIAEKVSMPPNQFKQLKFKGIGIDYDHYRKYKETKKGKLLYTGDNNYWFIGKAKSIKC